jgi:hypothetical protein
MIEPQGEPALPSNTDKKRRVWELAGQLADTGYRALAAKAHPDVGGTVEGSPLDTGKQST